MQIKGIVFSVTLSLFATSLIAQSSKSVSNKRKPDTVSSVVVKPGINNCFVTNNVICQKKPVPLAGQVAYFGDMNDYVESYTLGYMAKHNRTLSAVQNKSIDPFSLIDNVLQQYDIPKELKYLAVIESALNHNARSRVGAVGPWQFMEGTGRMMGLSISKKRDDRKDWYKSTTAAAKYLTTLYEQLNDWLLVVAAYNSGPTPVLRAIAKTGSSNFWDIKKYLPKETQGHVLAFIATATIFEQLNGFIGIKDLPENLSFTSPNGIIKTVAVKKPAFTDEELKRMAIIRISEPLSIDLISQDLNIERKLLEKWNPDYDVFLYDNEDRTETYSFRIPKEKLDNFIDRKEFLTKRSRQMFTEMSM